MLLLDLSNCGPSGLLRVLYFFKLILDIVFVVVPIGLIILLIIDFSKAIISGDTDAQGKVFKLATKRIINAVLVFFVPTIVSIFNTILGDLGVEYSDCYENINLDAINTLEAEEIAKEEAQKAARLALLQQQQKEAEMNPDGTYVINNAECDGMVYYDYGIFYVPSKSYKNGTPETKGSAKYGYNKYFYNMLTKFINDAAEEGYTIKMSTTDYGAWRPLKIQQYYYNCYKNKNCNNGNLAAVPGTSKHGWGIASDLKYGSNAAKNWAHDNAEYYGLNFSVCKSYPNNCSEPWHIQPALIKIDDSVVKKCS